MEYIVIIMIIFSVINSLVKAKKKREQAEKRLQEQGRRRETMGEGTSAWQNQTFTPAKQTVQPYVQPYAQPYVQPYARPAGEEGSSLEYSEPSAQKPAASRMQAPVESRNQGPISSQMQAPIGSLMQSRMSTSMQTEGRSNSAPSSRSNVPPVSNPFGLFGDLMSDIEAKLNGEKTPPQVAQASPYSTAHDSEGASEWNHTMQAGSLCMTPGVKEGECEDIAHYHSRVENGSMIPASTITSMSSSMLDNATTITSSSIASPVSSSMNRGSMRFGSTDMRRAVIWTEILKRPKYGVSPRMR